MKNKNSSDRRGDIDGLTVGIRYNNTVDLQIASAAIGAPNVEKARTRNGN